MVKKNQTKISHAPVPLKNWINGLEIDQALIYPNWRRKAE
jgi:hypothetical protein